MGKHRKVYINRMPTCLLRPIKQKHKRPGVSCERTPTYVGSASTPSPSQRTTTANVFGWVQGPAHVHLSLKIPCLIPSAPHPSFHPTSNLICWHDTMHTQYQKSSHFHETPFSVHYPTPANVDSSLHQSPNQSPSSPHHSFKSSE